MKAITIAQPWASLVAIGAKRIETRTWPTKYRGPIAIHAAKGFPGSAKRFCECNIVCDALGWPRMGAVTQESLDQSARLIKSLPLGCVIAIAQIVDCQPTEYLDGFDARLSDIERAFGNYDPGRFGFLLKDIRAIEPVQVKGALSLWEWINPREVAV